MAEKFEIYECEDCKDLLEVLRSGSLEELKCCDCEKGGFKKLEEKTEDEGYEKHVPVVERDEDEITVKVGSNPHPMEEGHHIEWIEVIDGDRTYKQFLKAGDKPEAEFEVESENIKVREHCNIHGLWSA